MKKSIFREIYNSNKKDTSKKPENENTDVLETETVKHTRRRKKEENE